MSKYKTLVMVCTPGCSNHGAAANVEWSEEVVSETYIINDGKEDCLRCHKKLFYVDADEIDSVAHQVVDALSPAQKLEIVQKRGENLLTITKTIICNRYARIP